MYLQYIQSQMKYNLWHKELRIKISQKDYNIAEAKNLLQVSMNVLLVYHLDGSQNNWNRKHLQCFFLIDPTSQLYGQIIFHGFSGVQIISKLSISFGINPGDA